jgi:2,4-dienoyl-CoA reductase-like NADH-dependent reductase (Old Yellow Enzyme family)
LRSIVFGPSTIPFGENYPRPKAMTLDDIDALEKAYVDAVEKCKLIGCASLCAFISLSDRTDLSIVDFIEIHGAHGYLLHSFCSPLSNDRTDMYGGSLENRLRLPLRIVRAARKAWGNDKPLFFRVSASDWAEGPERDVNGEWKSWGIEQTVELARRLKAEGVDLVDTSSGGNWSAQKIPIGPMYQVRFDFLKLVYGNN